MRNIIFTLALLVSLVTLGCASQSQQSFVKPPQIDRISEEELAKIMPVPVEALSLDDVVKMSKEGVAAGQVIEEIKKSNSLYDLTPSQSIELNKQGVDIKVLDYIYESREQVFRNNVADEINKREIDKRRELEKLKRKLWDQQRSLNSFCGLGSYGPYPYGAFGSHFGIGAGFARPWGCW